MGKLNEHKTTLAEASTPGEGANAEREQLLAEIAALKRQLARKAEEFVPAPAPTFGSAASGHGPRKYIVSFDHHHKGFVTPSAFFAQQAAEIVPGRAAAGIRAAGQADIARAATEWEKQMISRRVEANATEVDAAEQAILLRARPIEAISEADAKAAFCRLHGIQGWSCEHGPEVRELSAEELATGEWGELPKPPVTTFGMHAPAPKKKPQPTGPTGHRDEALREVLAW